MGFIPSSAIAWDSNGHKIVANIAWEHMTPQTRQSAINILLKAPEESHLSVFYLQDSRSIEVRQRDYFMLVSTWADIVRDRNIKNRYLKFNHPTWHYLNTFWRETDGEVELVTELTSDKENIVERLSVFNKTLSDHSTPDADKAVALAWILHLVGDIHQPLHNSARVTKYDPKGDRGGNTFSLSPKDTPQEERKNLHWYWDSIIGINVLRLNVVSDSEYLPPIAQQIMKKHPFTKMEERLKIGKFDEWQQEGFQIASTKVYPKSLRYGEMPSEEYKNQAFEISQEQLALAGYRLGEMLNQIFANSKLETHPKE
jgi:hypothetical protein